MAVKFGCLRLEIVPLKIHGQKNLNCNPQKHIYTVLFVLSFTETQHRSTMSNPFGNGFKENLTSNEKKTQVEPDLVLRVRAIPSMEAADITLVFRSHPVPA